ncbi:hypothetical protein DL96DRAFT_1597215 [Flagelloscypha sp. PMI_526]|nr:hypothetical protein DL96DRAFT_1597215 [Flagelloscypha sp. PMI_526]
MDTLRSVLEAVWSGQQHLPFNEQDLIDQLLVNKNALLKLFDVGPRKQAEQTEIQSGRINVGGKPIMVDPEFAQWVNFLAQQLDCSELYIAQLLFKMPATLSVEQKLEGVISLFHSHRTVMLDAIELLLALGLAAEQGATASPFAQRVLSFLRSQLLSATAPSTWVTKMFNEIGALSATIERVYQNARQAPSATVAPSSAGNATFGSDILTERAHALENERRRMASFYVTLARLGAFKGEDIKSLDPATQIGQNRLALASDAPFVSHISKKLSAANADWRDGGLKAVVLLRWTLFLVWARESDAALERKEHFAPDELEASISTGVQGDSFVYLSRTISQIRNERQTLGLAPLVIGPTPETLPSQMALAVLNAYEKTWFSQLRGLPLAPRASQDEAFITHHLHRHCLGTILLLSSTCLAFFTVLWSQRQHCNSGDSSPSESQSNYLQLREADDGRLPAFLQWAVWSTPSQQPAQVTALYNMLGGLAKGPLCSELAYNFMASGKGEVIPNSQVGSSSQSISAASWHYVFNTLAAFATPHGRVSQPTGNFPLSSSHPVPHPPPQNALSAEKVLLGRSFLVLLSTAVAYSAPVRKALFSHVHFRPVASLANLISLGIPLELKGAIFDSLAAFCQPGAGPEGLEICRTVWLTLEKVEVINVRPLQTGFGALSPVKGVEVELEQVEATNRMYPVTIPFLHLLCTLLHTSKRIALHERDDTSTFTPYRMPGVGPYVSFVLDTVLANIGGREFSKPSDQWEMMGSCLCFIERALASYSLEELLLLASRTATPQARRDAIIPFLIHPGYEILKRLLSDTPLLHTLLSSLVEGLYSFDRGLARTSPAFSSTIVRLLRIVHRTLEIQDHFLDILIPYVSELDVTTIIPSFHSRSYFTRFDQALTFGTDYVPAVAAYIGIDEYAHTELGLLSVKILGLLSASPVAANVSALIQRSEHSFRILEGVSSALSMDNFDDPDEEALKAEEATGAGAPDSLVTESFPQAVRMAILNLFLTNTTQDSRFPNLAEFLLFGGQEQWSPRSSGRVIIRLVSDGVPVRDEPNARSLDTLPLFVRLPTLAEKCYRVIYQLCMHPRSPQYLMRDLRTEDFFARQLAAVPLIAPEVQNPDALLEVLYPDGTRIATSTSTLCSFLKLRACIIDLAALDLHRLTNGRFGSKVSDLLNILFGRGSATQGLHQYGQARMRIIEFIESLSLDWQDGLAVNPRTLEYFTNLDLSTCTVTDDTGIELLDRHALLLLLASAKRTLMFEGRVTNEGQRQRVDDDKDYILLSCIVENNRRLIAQAVSIGFESLQRILDVTLTKCFSRIPGHRRESILFELLSTIPPIITSTNTAPSTAVLLSETVLSCMAKLREDRLQKLSSEALPSERLQTILRDTLHCLLNGTPSEQARGNLYAVLINFLQLVNPTSTPDSSLQRIPLDSSLSSSLSQSLVLSRVPAASSQDSLVMQCSTILKTCTDKLAAAVSRDAIDGSEVWRTIAFMLLDSLARLSAQERQHPLLTALVRHGVLDNFIRSLKDSDERLMSILRPDPANLNPLYIYESKMSFFIALAQSRAGAERLLEARIIPILSQCDFLDSRPEGDQSFMDQESLLPPAIARYHQLFLPAVQIVDAIITTVGSRHTTAMSQAVDFLSNHAGTVSTILKESTDSRAVALIEELQLVLALCSAAIPQIPKSELMTSTTAFGSIHSAILGLSTKFLSGRRWLSDIIPQTEKEVANASIPALGRPALTVFDESVLKVERHLLNALVQYLGSSSQFTDSDINVVLSPVVSSPRFGDRGSNFLATVPTVGDVLETLENLCLDLAETLKHIQSLTAEIASKEQISLEQQSLALSRFDDQQLDIAQKRDLAAQEFERIRQEEIEVAHNLTATIEMTLLLSWRHISFYAEGKHRDTTKVKASMAHAMRLLANVDTESFKRDVASRLSSVVGRLHYIMREEIWSEGQPDLALVAVLTRRLKESVGLEDQDHEDDGLTYVE